MDDRFKNALDHVTPDETVLERLIQSEVNLFRNALTLLCWGLVLTGLQINFDGIELPLYSTWIGSVLLMLGLWMLRKENRRMKLAFRLSVVGLLIRMISYWLDAVSVKDSRLFIGMIFTISLALLWIIQAYALFTGLRELAHRFENPALGRRLMRCFVLDLVLYLLIPICFLVPFLLYPLLPYALFVMVYMPASVHKLKHHVPLGKRVTSVTALNIRVAVVLILYTAMTFGGEVSFLHLNSAPSPEASLYTAFSSLETAPLRERLKELGMPEDVLRDLPDDEVRLYDGIYASTSETIQNSEITKDDGGRLEAYSFVGLMPGGRVRQLFYYRWLELPRHAYTDVLSIPCALHYNPGALNGFEYSDFEEKGLALYDQDGRTYRQNLLNRGELVAFTDLGASPMFPSMTPVSGRGRVTQIQFRLYPRYENQRGYVAMSAYMANLEEPWAFNSMATYVHQQSLWNRPRLDILNATASYGYSRVEHRAFSSAFIGTNSEYTPEGYVWPED